MILLSLHDSNISAFCLLWACLQRFMVSSLSQISTRVVAVTVAQRQRERENRTYSTARTAGLGAASSVGSALGASYSVHFFLFLYSCLDSLCSCLFSLILPFLFHSLYVELSFACLFVLLCFVYSDRIGSVQFGLFVTLCKSLKDRLCYAFDSVLLCCV